MEIIAAIFEALAELLFAFLEAVVLLFAAVFEFVFLALTQGKSAASEQYQKRKQEHKERAEQHNKLREEKRKKRTGAVETTSASPIAEHHTPSITPKQYTILGSLAFFIIIGLIITWVVLDQIQQQRLAETRSRLNQLADKFAEQIKDREIVDPVTGKLRDRDAWQQPIDLAVDKMLIGSLVVVRSTGPDRKPGTIDDLLEIRTIRAPAKEVGGELAKRGVKAIRNRIAEMLPGGEKEQQPEEIDDAEK